MPPKKRKREISRTAQAKTARTLKTRRKKKRKQQRLKDERDLYQRLYKEELGAVDEDPYMTAGSDDWPAAEYSSDFSDEDVTQENVANMEAEGCVKQVEQENVANGEMEGDVKHAKPENDAKMDIEGNVKDETAVKIRRHVIPKGSVKIELDTLDLIDSASAVRDANAELISSVSKELHASESRLSARSCTPR